MPDASKAMKVKYAPNVTNPTVSVSPLPDGFCPTVGPHTAYGYMYTTTAKVVDGRCINCNDTTEFNGNTIVTSDGFGYFKPDYCSMQSIADQVASNAKCDNLTLKSLCASYRASTPTWNPTKSWWNMTFVYGGMCNGSQQQVVVFGGYTIVPESKNMTNDTPMISNPIPASKWTWAVSGPSEDAATGGAPQSNSPATSGAPETGATPAAPAPSTSGSTGAFGLECVARSLVASSVLVFITMF